MLHAQLPANFVEDTVHKFQRRECDEIVFSTVLDKKNSSQRKLGFVDDPHLVNVAVSRAKNRFTLVTAVVSAFDLLYKEYDRSLENLNARLTGIDSRYKSEQILAQILRNILAGDDFKAITFHCQVAFIQLVSTANSTFTPREQEFMKNRASCDFVLYFKIGKAPLAVIEVDGGASGSPPVRARWLKGRHLAEMRHSLAAASHRGEPHRGESDKVHFPMVREECRR